MAQDSEKRFHQIMDKLFSDAPKSIPSSSSSSHGEQQTRGKKRQDPSSALALVEPKTGADFIDKSLRISAPAASLQAPLCRPWDRGDLMRRMATFKSMTWFAKPQVINAVNCARRGWVNVDMDTIACRSCGARLLFSTPSSWPQQQVEKAALVFSLKLDNGHKLLCPWIDNHCDETLVEFPPMTPQDLIDRFSERSSKVLHLLALPVISSTAIEYMRRPELEEFLNQPITPLSSNVTTESSQSDSFSNEYEASSAKLYYQAQKLISLCGWEPRSLPYVVDCKENPHGLVRNTDIVDLSHEAANGKHLSIIGHSADTNEISDANEQSGSCSELESGPKSVVLYCKLCGAIAGLWVFSTVLRPLEFCRVIGYLEVNANKNSDGQNSYVNIHQGNRAEQTSHLSLTIAGGPPATKQNFKATVSLPVVGRNLRARLVSDTRDGMASNQKHSDLNNIDSVSEPVARSKNMDLSDSVKDDSVGDQQHKTTENSDTLSKDNDNSISPGSASAAEQIGSESVRNGSNVHGKTSAQSYAQEVTMDKTTDPVKYKAKGSAAGNFGLDRTTDPVNYKAKGSAAGKDMNQSSSSRQMEFDPIRQHRHFCPWIQSTGGKLPGWRQTLSALHRQKDSSQPSAPSTSLIKVDDPITSVRNLFTSPSPKRAKNR